MSVSLATRKLEAACRRWALLKACALATPPPHLPPKFPSPPTPRAALLRTLAWARHRFVAGFISDGDLDQLFI